MPIYPAPGFGSPGAGGVPQSDDESIVWETGTSYPSFLERSLEVDYGGGGYVEDYSTELFYGGEIRQTFQESDLPGHEWRYSLSLGNLSGVKLEGGDPTPQQAVIAFTPQGGVSMVHNTDGHDTAGVSCYQGVINLAITGQEQTVAVSVREDSTHGALVVLVVPTIDPEVVGAMWNDGGTLKISAG